jgi:hypothetical protein
MKRQKAQSLFWAVVLFAAAVWAQPGNVAEDKKLFGDIDSITAELSKISGLEMRHKVQYDLISKDQVKQFLEERIKEQVKPEEIRVQELTLKKFGLVPPNFDLKKTTVDLLSEQAAAFYDYRKKKLFVVESDVSETERTALVHELAHALADQNFDLQKFIDKASKDDDSSLARLAVMEGQATWLMTEYQARQLGMSLGTSPAALSLLGRVGEISTGQFPAFDEAPLYMKETLLFPYTQGMLFQQRLFKKDGQASFAEVFRHPPVSTQQILHPDTYFAGLKPTRPKLPTIAKNRGYRDLVEGEVGELDHTILLRQYVGKNESESLAPKWRGGVYRLLERKKGDATILLYASDWETRDAALEFFQAYRRILKAKWRKMEISSESDGELAGHGDDGYFLLRLNGTGVTSTEGLPTAPRAALN